MTESNDIGPEGKREAFTVGGRNYYAWVPAERSASTPLLITHDAQSYLLDTDQTWNGMNWGVLDALADGHIATDSQGQSPLIVSVHLLDETRRINELAPEDLLATLPDPWGYLSAELTPAEKDLAGNAYIDNVVANLLPEVERRYGLQPERRRTAIAGASMGGVASLYAAIRHPETFGAALAYSTHWLVGRDELIDYCVAGLTALKPRPLVWSDRGDLQLDAEYEPYHERFVREMVGAGWQRDHEFMATVYHGSGHREDYWARRIEHPINWWLSSL